MLNFNVQLNDTASIVEIALKEMLQKQGNDLMSAPIRHAVLNGGKRLRAFLVIHSCNIFEVQKDTAIQAAIAIECLHAYSLVHDDLPCMDDDKIRRGKISTYIKFGESTAVLAGNSLLTMAFEILVSSSLKINEKIKVDLVKKLSESSGHLGIAGGQYLDLSFEKKKFLKVKL